MSNSKPDQPIDFAAAPKILPTMIEVGAIGAVGLLLIKFGLKVPVLSDGIIATRKATKVPLQWIGGEEFTKNKHFMGVVDTGITFLSDAGLALLIALGAGRTKSGLKIFNAVNDFTEKQCERVYNLFGMGQSRA